MSSKKSKEVKEESGEKAGGGKAMHLCAAKCKPRGECRQKGVGNPFFIQGNTAQFTAEALSVASLADFPATVTKMLANTQSIRCAFCLTCQKTGRRASTLRIVRYCLNIHYQFVTIAAKCKNPSFENVLCFKRERAVSRAPQACRSI